MGEVGRESRIAIYFQTNFRTEAWQLIVLLLTLLCSGIYERFDFNEPYFPFFVPKIADTIILYSRKVLKTFNCHLNHNREFTMITGNTLRDHF